MRDYRRFRLTHGDEIAIAELIDPKLFDTLVVSDLENELLDLAELGSPTKLLVDFEKVTQCSTSVISGLLRTKKRLLHRGGQLGLCGMTDSVRSAFRMLNLEGAVFHIYDTRDQAMKAMRGAGSGERGANRG